ncbi:MAG TPA: penicillin-binding protein 2 [Candidatus Paceibacterota bacterium]|nr:penicillin-binding protein 2 [Verrucomicrobiota bacterium]HSA11510.1 penicillin-binding protein 2 [Candidatus Paceibacterota bacterium]
MAKQLQFRRLVALALLLVAAFAGLTYRLVDLQVLRYEELSRIAWNNTHREFLLEPRRGDILDAKGNLLATSVFVKTVCADPSLIGSRQAEVARAVAPLLHMSEGELHQRLMPRPTRNATGVIGTNRYVVLKRKVPMETWQQIQAAMRSLSFGLDEKKLSRAERAFYRDLRRAAVFVEKQDDQLRTYPNQALAAHVLGFVGMDEQEVNGTRLLQTSGKDGIERYYNAKLAGVRGWRVTEADRPGRELVALRKQDVEPRDGTSVVLTIDSVVQHIVEAALAEAKEKHSPVSISSLVVRPRTGEILALAILPNFDPNNPGAVGADARRNRVIADLAEPGSTFKIVAVSGALNDGIVRLEDVFDCEHGRFHFAGRVLHDHESYGMLTVEEIIANSSNIGAAKIGLKLGQSRLHDYIRNFGFGTQTGLPLLGEVSGIVHPVKAWSKVSIAQIPMGHGVAVTSLQMTMAMCAIANKGWLMQPMIVDRLVNRDDTLAVKYPPQRVRQVISEAAAAQMVEALKTAVSSGGTGAKAALEHYTVAGKTGTAQKSGGPSGYLPGKYFASFIGFFPADNPELCISVMMDEPKHGYYGGQIAAPVFKQIAERAASYLHIPPEDGAAPMVPATLTAPLDRNPPKTAAARSP